MRAERDVFGQLLPITYQTESSFEWPVRSEFAVYPIPAGRFAEFLCIMHLDCPRRSGTLLHFRSTSATQGERMSTGKTATLSFRIEPGLKEALRAAAEQEHRSIANMVEVMIREYCGRTGIAIGERAADPVNARKPNHRPR